MLFDRFKDVSNDYGLFIEQLVRFNKVKTCVEIGVAFGTTTHYLCKAVHDAQTEGTVYGYDVWAQHGVIKRCGQLSSKKEVDNYLRSEGHTNFILEQVNTTTPEFKNMIGKIGPIDFAFIDGCHSYGGIKNDFDIVYPLLSDHGMIMFHDTCVIDGCREFVIDLRDKYYNGEYDIVDFPYGGHRRFGLALLVKRSFSHGVLIDEICGSESSPQEIYKKESDWINSKK